MHSADGCFVTVPWGGFINNLATQCPLDFDLQDVLLKMPSSHLLVPRYFLGAVADSVAMWTFKYEIYDVLRWQHWQRTCFQLAVARMRHVLDK